MLLSEIGSTWRKWDLHVHTPLSALNNGFGNSWDTYVRNLFIQAIENDIHAIGVTDYFTIDGYKKIKQEYLNNPSKLQSIFSDEEIKKIKNILILPNIEFRLDLFVPSRKINNKVNFHVIFSDEVPIIEIEENFLHDIDFIDQGQPQDIVQKRKLKLINIIELGRRLKSEQESFMNDSDLVVGMNNIAVSSTQICEILNKSIFKNKYVLALPSDEDLNQVEWNGQGHNARKVLVQKSDFLMASNPNTILWGLGKKNNNIQDFIKEFKSLKPSIWGSDSHTYAELFVNNKDRMLWIKSDLSFDGLRQVKYEPKRVFIGNEPESKKFTDINSTVFIDRLIINKKTDLPSNEEWFDKLDIKINPGLVAVIGNKGSGKSALADIMSLCGNSKKDKHFSFLTNGRFNSYPEQKAKYFDAAIYWKDGKIDKVSLDSKPNSSNIEKVNYIPQSFLEKLCLGESDKELFEQEIRKIIFSRLPLEKRLYKHSLDEVISYKTEIFRGKIEYIKSELHLLNNKIVEIEDQAKPEFKNQVYEDIKALNTKVTILHEREPVEPKQPETKVSSREKQLLDEKIRIQRAELDDISELISSSIKKREELVVQIEDINKSTQAFSLFKDSIQKFITSQIAFLITNSINVNSVFSYSLNISELERLLKLKTERLKILNDELADANTSGGEIISLYTRQAILQNSLVDLQSSLDQPAKEYQAYLGAHAIWQHELTILSEESNRLEDTRVYIDELLNHVLIDYYRQREELLINLYQEKSEIINVYKELYEPIIKFKDKYKNQLYAYQIDFDASFMMNHFIEKFEQYISYAKSGSFYGKDAATRKLNSLINLINFNNIDDVVEFVNSIIKDLLFDTKDNNIVAKSVQSQLKQSVKTEDLYNFLYDIEYLEPIFQLKLAGKEIVSLSPGERGALLLIFYLLLDNDSTPLIIDQPEENLDNQSIYSILVPFIQEAKERRQVILITHNPNLAVVCDADQIIHVKIEKDNYHKVTCTTGAIENPIINSLLIEVLEGTFPAFDTRNHRYDITRAFLNKLDFNNHI